MAGLLAVKVFIRSPVKTQEAASPFKRPFQACEKRSLLLLLYYLPPTSPASHYINRLPILVPASPQPDRTPGSYYQSNFERALLFQGERERESDTPTHTQLDHFVPCNNKGVSESVCLNKFYGSKGRLSKTAALNRDHHHHWGLQFLRQATSVMVYNSTPLF
jgi:hypothetical protein